MQRGQRGMRLVRLHRGDGVEIDVALGDGRADRLDRLDLRPFDRPSRASLSARASRTLSWWNGSNAANSRVADRRGARGRKLLAADDGARARHSRPRGGAAPASRTFRRIGASRGSCATSAAMPACRSASVWRNDMDRSSSRHDRPVFGSTGKRRTAVKSRSHRGLSVAMPSIMLVKSTSCPSLLMTHARFPLCAEPERPSAPRPCAVGAAQLRHGARRGRAVPAADGGHRHDALPARVRGRDLRGPRLARARMGAAGAAAVRAFRRVPRGARQARRACS